MGARSVIGIGVLAPGMVADHDQLDVEDLGSRFGTICSCRIRRGVGLQLNGRRSKVSC